MHEKTVEKFLLIHFIHFNEDYINIYIKRDKSQIVSKVNMPNTGEFLSAKAQMKISLWWVSAYQLPLKEKLSHFATISEASIPFLASQSCNVKDLPVIKFTSKLLSHRQMQ